MKKIFLLNPNHYKLSVYLFSLTAIFIYLYDLYLFFSMKTFPLYSDEYGYYLDLKSFLENGNLASALSLDELYSKIGHFSFHGFGYDLFYGIFSTIIHTNNILHINLIISVLTIVLGLYFFTKNVSIFEKLFFIGLIVTYPVFFLYGFSFMTESIHIFFVPIVLYWVYLLTDKNRKNYVLPYILLIAVLSLLRQTWAIFLIALLFMHEEKNPLKIKIYYSLMIIVIYVLLIIEMHFFHAVYPNSFLKKLFENPDKISTFFYHFFINSKMYFFHFNSRIYFLTKIIFIISLLYVLFIGVFQKRIFALSVATIGALYFLAVLFLYDTFGWRDLRVLAVIYVANIMVLITYRKNNFLFFLVFLPQIFLFPSVYAQLKSDKIQTYIKNTVTNKIYTGLPQVICASVKKDRRKNLLFGIGKDTGSLNFNNLFLSLPVKCGNTQIAYTTYFFKGFDPEKTIVNYYLSKKKNINMPIAGNNLDLYIYKTGK